MTRFFTRAPGQHDSPAELVVPTAATQPAKAYPELWRETLTRHIIQATDTRSRF